MAELAGVLAAILSSGLGGSSVAATRYLAATVDPQTIGAFRFGGGALLLLPVALMQGSRWPARGDWLGVVALGLLFFAVFPILFNASLAHTTAARGALAISTLPLLTMAAGALLRVEALTVRKTVGVLLSMAGVVIALVTGLSDAPAGAWRGDLLMVGAALCMALYSVWSKPFIRRSDPIAFTAMGMAVGAACLVLASAVGNGFAVVATFGAGHWLAVGFLGLFGSALTLLPLGLRPRPHDAHARRHIRHGQPDHRRHPRRHASRRAAPLEPDGRSPDRRSRDLDRDHDAAP